jgi:SHS2 domain-containing protein
MSTLTVQVSPYTDIGEYYRQVHPPFEIIEHPADVGFLAYGATLEELFSNAALAMLSLACSPDGIEEREHREIEATGADTESLLFSWLAEILAVADAEQLVLRRCTVTEFTATRIRGTVWGEPYDPARHRAGTYIKAVTYHQFCVDKTAEGWRARVFLDL